MAADLTATPGNPASYKGSRAVVRHPSLSSYGGKEMDPGQVFMLRGLENDDRLVRLGFVDAFAKGGETFDCRVCGARFASMRTRDAHGYRRHEVSDSPEPLAPQVSDVQQIGENSFLGSEPDNDPGEAKDAPPLYLDKTAAALGVKPGPISL